MEPLERPAVALFAAQDRAYRLEAPPTRPPVDKTVDNIGRETDAPECKRTQIV